MTRDDQLDSLVWHRNLLAETQGNGKYTARELLSAWRGKFDYTAEEIKEAINRGEKK